LKVEYDGLRGQYDALMAKVKAGALPVEEALKLGQTIIEKRGLIEGEFEGIATDIKALQDAPGSKWAIIGAVLGQVLTIATGLKFVQSNGLLKTALGVTARGLDAATKGQAGSFILTELAGTNLSTDDMKRLTRPLREKAS
jgi:hypothetical protein